MTTITLQQARDLVNGDFDVLVGTGDPEAVAAEWAATTLTLEQAVSYADAGCFTAGAAQALADAGVTPLDAARQASDAGFRGANVSIGYAVANGDLRADKVADRLRDHDALDEIA